MNREFFSSNFFHFSTFQYSYSNSKNTFYSFAKNFFFFLKKKNRRERRKKRERERDRPISMNGAGCVDVTFQSRKRREERGEEKRLKRCPAGRGGGGSF